MRIPKCYWDTWAILTTTPVYKSGGRGVEYCMVSELILLQNVYKNERCFLLCITMCSWLRLLTYFLFHLLNFLFLQFLIPAKKLGLVQKFVALWDCLGHRSPNRCIHPQSIPYTAVAAWTLRIAGLPFWAVTTTTSTRTSWSIGPSTTATCFAAVSKLAHKAPPCPPFQMALVPPTRLRHQQLAPSSMRKWESSKRRLRRGYCAAMLIRPMARYRGPTNASWAGSPRATTATTSWPTSTIIGWPLTDPAGRMEVTTALHGVTPHRCHLLPLAWLASSHLKTGISRVTSDLPIEEAHCCLHRSRRCRKSLVLATFKKCGRNWVFCCGAMFCVRKAPGLSSVFFCLIFFFCGSYAVFSSLSWYLRGAGYWSGARVFF